MFSSKSISSKKSIFKNPNPDLTGSDFGLFFLVSLRRHTSTNSVVNVFGFTGARRDPRISIGHISAFLGRFYPTEFLKKRKGRCEIGTKIEHFKLV